MAYNAERNKKLRAFWGVTEKTLREWLKKGYPVEDPRLMAWTLITQPCTNSRLRKRAISVKDEYKTKPNARVDDSDIRDTDGLEYFRDFYAKKVKESIDADEPAKTQFWNDLLIKTENSIRQNKLAEKKLGIEKGELITRSEVERQIFSMAFWMMRSIDQSLREVTEQFDDPKKAWDILDEYLLDRRLVTPFAKACGPASGISLPDWYVEKVKDVIDDYIEDGRAIMEELIA